MPSLFQLLREKFPRQSYALFPEVRNATGFKGDRAADAVAMSLWPSRGLEFYGFEFKASRSDWQRELAEPSKAEAVCKYMDRWWVVAEKAGIVKPEELPKTWGLMVANDAHDSIRIVVQAPPLTPIPADRLFMASLLRAAQKEVDDEVSKAKLPEGEIRQRILVEMEGRRRETEMKIVEAAREGERRKFERYIERIEAFKGASGIDLLEIGTWQYGQIAAALKFLVAQEDAISTVERAVKEFATLAETGAAALRELKSAGPRTEAA